MLCIQHSYPLKKSDNGGPLVGCVVFMCAFELSQTNSFSSVILNLTSCWIKLNNNFVDRADYPDLFDANSD